MLERFVDSLQNAIMGLRNDLLTLVMRTAIIVTVVVIVFALVRMLAS